MVLDIFTFLSVAGWCDTGGGSSCPNWSRQGSQTVGKKCFLVSQLRLYYVYDINKLQFPFTSFLVYIYKML